MEKEGIEETHLCDRCGNTTATNNNSNNNPAQNPQSRARYARLRIAAQVLVSVVVMVLWTALIGAYLARNPHLLHRYWYSGSKNLIDLCKFPSSQVTKFQTLPLPLLCVSPLRTVSPPTLGRRHTYMYTRKRWKKKTRKRKDEQR